MRTSIASPKRATLLAWAWPAGSLLAIAAAALLADLMPLPALAATPDALPVLMEVAPAEDAALALAAMV